LTVLRGYHQGKEEFCDTNGYPMNTILATTDFSIENWSMLQYAAQLAKDLGYKLRLIHATHVPLAFDEFFSTEAALAALSASDRGQMLQEVVRLRNKFGPDLQVDAEVKIGYVEETLRDELSNGNIALVVMAVSKSTRLERFLFGSPVMHAIGKLPCPILLVPKNYTNRKWKSVAVAFDKQELGTVCNLELAHDALMHAHGKVHVVHVQQNTQDTVSEEEESALSNWLHQPITKVHEIKLQENNVSETLLDWTHRYRPNTTVMIARQHGLLHQLMQESVSRQVAFHTSTPVMICSNKMHNFNTSTTNIQADKIAQ
jgi:nucleotide-binding universal stress UspA family protein